MRHSLAAEPTVNVLITKTELALLITALYIAEDYPTDFTAMAKIVTNMERISGSMVSRLRKRLNSIDNSHDLPDIAIMFDPQQQRIESILGAAKATAWLIDYPNYSKTISQPDAAKQVLKAFNERFQSKFSHELNKYSGKDSPPLFDNSVEKSTVQSSTDKTANKAKNTYQQTDKRPPYSFILDEIQINNGMVWHQFTAGLRQYKRLS